MTTFSPLDPPRPRGIKETLFWKEPPGAATAMALSHLATDAPLLVVPADTTEALRLESEFQFLAEVPVLPFPDWETLPYDSFSPHQDIISSRLRTLRRL